MTAIVITEFMDPAVAAELTDKFGGIYDPTLVDRRDELKSMLATCRALVVRNRTKVDEDLIASAPKLEVVGRLGVGLDNIDLNACRRRQIPVCPAIGTNHIAVAEYVLGAMLILSRPAFFVTPAVSNGEWPRTTTSPGRELAGRRLGLVGFGLIARTVAARARALGMQVQATDPMFAPTDAAWAESGVTPVSLETLLQSSDVLSIHVPLTPSTRGMIGADALRLLPDGALVINTARGGILDERAVVQALRSGKLGGAALDVFEQEPLPKSATFIGVPNLVLTPHLAGLTEQSALRMSTVVAKAVQDILSK